MMRSIRALLALAALVAATPLLAEPLARLDGDASLVRDVGKTIEITLALSEPVPFRTLLLADPPRLVADFREVDFGTSAAGALNASAHVAALRWGRFRPGWSRLVAELSGPYAIDEAGIDSATGRVQITLRPVSDAQFAALAGVPADADWDLPRAAVVTEPKRRQDGSRPLVVMLDPGHGGIDPGAETEGTNEAALMLVFARELAGVLGAAKMDARLTRAADIFVPLETRISLARAAGADVMVSLHADALEEGRAVGATIYKLSDAASDAAASLLAARHDRADLLAGVDLTAQDDAIAGVLMDLARIETQPRADRLADDLVRAIGEAGGRMHRHPIQAGAFSVLKAPDMPSLLLELGFLSSPADLKHLQDPAWRAMMQGAIRDALANWAVADSAEARLVRQ